MNQAIPDVPSFTDAYDRGSVVHKGGYHQPENTRPHCGCTATTSKGAYRDMTIDVDDLRVHFYHQSPVVVRYGNKLRISSCGWQTRSTKERINRYLPSGFKVYREDGDWFVSRPSGGDLEFHDGMVIDRP